MILFLRIDAIEEKGKKWLERYSIHLEKRNGLQLPNFF